MLPFQRKKVDISVGNITAGTFVHAENLSHIETEPAGAAAFREVWKAAYTQERADEDAESWDIHSVRCVVWQC
jgi:hypothetical protein